MSLYFDECVKEEQISGDSDKDKIVFTFPWIIDIPPLPEDDETEMFSTEISVNTNYNRLSAKWKLCLTNDDFEIESYELFRFWNESSFFITYKLFSDNEMCTEIYSSERIAVETSSGFTLLSPSAFTTEGSMKNFSDAFMQRKVAKVVVFVEFILLKKYFIHPLKIFELSSAESYCEKLPDDLDSDFRFEFLKEGDFTIKCRDGTVPAIKMVLNVSSSSFLKEQLKQNIGMELMVDHSVDVVKPLITFIHSGYFEMPKNYDLDFADRLLKALDFFDLEKNQKFKIRLVIQHSLLQKYIKEPHDFDLFLQWISLASRHFLNFRFMLPVIISNKYYYKWLERFPENQRNSDTLMLQNFFGSFDQAMMIFKKVEDNFMSLFLVNTIMP